MLSFHNKTRKHSKAQKAFSFVEVMVSLFVLSIGFVGVIQLATTTLHNSLLQRDAVVASLLVQEGVELVYNVRDTNVVRFGETHGFDGDPNTSADDMTAALGSCRISYSTPALECGGGVDLVLYKKSNGFYGYAGAGTTPTKFSRKVIIEAGSDVNSLKITSVVVWGGKPFPSVPTTGYVATCTKLAQCSFAQTELQKN